ncbi:methyltransferase domain-containing protein [Kitasatospora sp. RB6PN24]|uniref:methyltransferase domain-containing protein n=1 Tax=Kitasatospora humi TaxID=2893891 RepID=UPI001E28AD24|nr:methyltransferase domain-containing protein [Kitasatospora humi]MCC9308822.1 methyltransferase domain-containing protein [Kitasatospora humi]
MTDGTHDSRLDTADRYVFDRAWEREHERLAALEAVYDGVTLDRLAGLGVAEGWRCLEVGCGAGSVARWLAGRVGATGSVEAIDLDPRFADGHGLPNLTVRRQDVLTDPLPADAYDLVHARALLEHLPAREEALHRLVTATRPGGWVMVEDFDIEGAMAAAVARYWPVGHGELADRLYAALQAAFGNAGGYAGCGRWLPDALADAGLAEVGALVHAPVLPGGTPFLVLTLRQLRTPLLATGRITAQELDATVELIQRQEVRYMPNFMVTAWGRRPSRPDRRTGARTPG